MTSLASPSLPQSVHFVPPSITIDLAARPPIARLHQRRASGVVPGTAGVELSLVDRERADPIGLVGAAAVDPARAAVVAVDVAGLFRALLVRARVKMAVADGQGHDVSGIARPAAVGPRLVDPAGVDAEREISVVRLRGGHAGGVQQAQRDAGAGIAGSYWLRMSPRTSASSPSVWTQTAIEKSRLPKAQGLCGGDLDEMRRARRICRRRLRPGRHRGSRHGWPWPD